MNSAKEDIAQALPHELTMFRNHQALRTYPISQY
jgi:hypothetical protein